MKQKVLLTGAKGFIGYHLYNAIRTTYDVIPADNCTGLAQSDRDIDVDCENWDLLNCELPNVDIVVHLAAKAGVKESMIDPKKYYVNNCLVTKRIFNHYTKAKILYASSSSVVECRHPYAMTKAMCELMAPKNAIGMRFFTVYGPKGRPDMLIRKLSEGKKFEEVSNHFRDFTHVYDVVDGIKILMQKDVKHGVYDIGAGTPISVKYLCSLFNQYPKEVEVPNESLITCADPTFMKSLGWNAKISIEEGIKKL